MTNIYPQKPTVSKQKLNLPIIKADLLSAIVVLLKLHGEVKKRTDRYDRGQVIRLLF